MESSHNRLKVLRGGGERKSYAKKSKDDVEQVVCRECEADTGVATSTWIPATIAPMIQGNDVIGGTSGLICAHCLSRGKVSRVV